MIEDLDHIVNPDIFERARRAVGYFTEDEIHTVLRVLNEIIEQGPKDYTEEHEFWSARRKLETLLLEEPIIS